jgi:hypothetical protein
VYEGLPSPAAAVEILNSLALFLYDVNLPLHPEEAFGICAVNGQPSQVTRTPPRRIKWH